MAKYTLKILWCSQAFSHHKFLKYAWPFINIMNERVEHQTACFSVSAGSQNITNSTKTYAELQREKETEEINEAVQYLIPKKLLLVTQPSEESNETVPFPVQAALQMFDSLDRWVNNLGTRLTPWKVTASLIKGSGDPNARLLGNTTVQFVNGTANFSNLAISHNGTGYEILYKVTYPTTVSFQVTHGSHVIKERKFGYNFTTNFTEVFDAMPFAFQPSVTVYDTANSEVVETGWKNRTWLFKAELITGSNTGAEFLGSSQSEIRNGVGSFHNLSIDQNGNDFQIILTIETTPSSSYKASYTTEKFNVKDRVFYLYLSRGLDDCNDTVVCGQQPIVQVRSVYPNGLAGNIGKQGRDWHINVTSCYPGSRNKLLGTKYRKIPMSGEIVFSDLSFDFVSSNERLCFSVNIHPSYPKYDSLNISNNNIVVSKRQLEIREVVKPGDANETIVFGKQPVVQVYDKGTNLPAYPLRENIVVTASLSVTHNGGVLSGTKTVTVGNTTAHFTDLKISAYGVGFVLQYQTDASHTVSFFH